MYSSRSTALVVVCVVLLMFASIFVGLRFKVRSNIKAGLAADDFTILGALLLQYAAGAMTIYGAVKGGEGDSYRNLLMHPSEAAAYSKILFAGPLIFATTIALIKVSTLLLFKRIFITKGFSIACYTMMALTTGWLFASIFPQIFQSNPISATWTEPGQHRVINYPEYLLSLAAINTVMDLIIVTMPLFVIRTLHMSSRRKLLVSGIFLLGLFCIVASGVRLYYFVKLKNTPNGPDTAYTNVVDEDNIWSFIEPQMSIVAACLPTLAPLFHGSRDLAAIVRSVRSVLSLRSVSSGTKGKRTNASNTSLGHENKDARRTWLQLDSDASQSNNVNYERGVELENVHDNRRVFNGTSV